MDPDRHRDLAEALRARLAAAGLEPPAGEDGHRLERDLALHLDRVAEVAAADLGPADPPLTDPTGRVGSGSVEPGWGAVGAAVGAVDNPTRPAPGSATLPEGAPIAAAEVPPRPGSGAPRPEPSRPEPGRLAGELREQARRIRDGEATSVELVERALERIGLLDDRLGAFVLVLGERARAEAAERDAARRRGRRSWPPTGPPPTPRWWPGCGGPGRWSSARPGPTSSPTG